MNRENLLRVADAIEKHEIEGLGFNMIDYRAGHGRHEDLSGHGCATTACIGGWAVALMQGGLKLLDPETNVPHLANDFLDLTSTQSACLFRRGPKGVMFGNITPAQAANVLRYAAEFGRVDWDAAQEWAAKNAEAV